MSFKNLFLSVLFLVIAIACRENEHSSIEYISKSNTDTFLLYTKPSDLINNNFGFNSPIAINKIAEIENEYFNSVDKSFSKYYGTEWKKVAEMESVNDSTSVFEDYLSNVDFLGLKADSLHCTMYAMKALQVGLDTNFTMTVREVT